jgi:hypothetical protein
MALGQLPRSDYILHCMTYLPTFAYDENKFEHGFLIYHELQQLLRYSHNVYLYLRDYINNDQHIRQYVYPSIKNLLIYVLDQLHVDLHMRKKILAFASKHGKYIDVICDQQLCHRVKCAFFVGLFGITTYQHIANILHVSVPSFSILIQQYKKQQKTK